VPDKPVPLRRNRDFILLWSGQVVSTIGTRVSSLAYPLLVLGLTHSPAKAGLVGFAQTLPFLLFYLPAGALVDRWNRKRVMLVADAGRAVALGSIALALALDRLTLAQIAVVAFVEGSLFVFFQLSEGAALPHVVPKEQLPTALAQNQAREQGAELVGQPLGGLLFGIGRLVPFVFDAVTYAVSFVTLLFVRPMFQEERPRSVTRLRAEVVEGIVWLWQRPLLRAVVLLVGASNFAFAALTLVMIVRARQLGASPALIGAMFAFLGVGAIVGAVIAPWVQRHMPAPVVIIGSLWLYAVGMAVLPLASSALVLGALAAVMWIGGPPFNVVVGTYRYALVSDRLQARTASAARLIAWGPIPLGSLAAGFLLEAVGATKSFLVLAAISVAVALAATLTRAVRDAPPIEALLAQDTA
jgi:predicted MFS family arabinose efflux permease